jgi:hypothetical protein
MMSIGGIFLFIAFLLFFCLGLGMMILPRAEMFAFAALVLGILLAGIPLPPWRLP